eukprot:2152296-Rhodomonas_salina.1
MDDCTSDGRLKSAIPSCAMGSIAEGVSGGVLAKPNWGWSLRTGLSGHRWVAFLAIILERCVASSSGDGCNSASGSAGPDPAVSSCDNSWETEGSDDIAWP